MTDIAALGYNSTTQMLLAARQFVAMLSHEFRTLLVNCLTEERLNTVDLVLHTEPVELRDFILQSYGESDAQSSPRIHLVLPETAQWVTCDQHLIDIALSNLVNNALKYSPDDSPVPIRLTPAARTDKIAIRVEDEGAAPRRQREARAVIRTPGRHLLPYVTPLTAY